MEKLLAAVKQGNDCKVSFVLTAGVEEPQPFRMMLLGHRVMEMKGGSPGYTLSGRNGVATIKGDGPGTATIEYSFRNGPKSKDFTVIVDLVFVKPDR